jgi:hypothetical protein
MIWLNYRDERLLNWRGFQRKGRCNDPTARYLSPWWQELSWN